MKRIIYTFLLILLCMVSALGQPYNLSLNLPESGINVHQATNNITFKPGYSYTPNGGNLIANIVSPITSHPHIIALGSFSNDFTRADTQNTAVFTNNYEGNTTKDVVHQFSLTQSMEVTISHCGSVLQDTYMSLLDASGKLIASNDEYEGDGDCENQSQAYIRKILVPGIYYVVSEGAEYPGEDGVIQITITGYYYNNEFNYSEIPSSYSSDPRGVGAVGGSFAVSATGGATYSIPIEVPVGVGGMQPSLSITYNSQSGNGVAGMGSSLSGISAIIRAPKDIYHDTTAKGMTYLDDDAFALNGQRLIYSSGTMGQEGAIYYPESDPFTKVIAHGTYTSGNCNTWFEVQDKNGMTYYYGQLTTARQGYTSGSVTRVNAWYLNHVEDPLGNYIDYEYAFSSLYPYLNAIVYGKNKNITSTLENKVEFVYESRTDITRFVLEGIKGEMNKRLKTIISKTGTSVFREYTLAYTNSDVSSKLTSVTEKNGAGEVLKPTQLNWNYVPAFTQTLMVPTVNNANVLNSPSFANQSYTSGDMNGDGIVDLLSTFQVKVPTGDNGYRMYGYAYINYGLLDANGKPQFLTGKSFQIAPDFFDPEDENTKLGNDIGQNGGKSVFDHNGDGVNELLISRFQLDRNSSGDTIYEALRFYFVGDKMYTVSTYPLLNRGEYPLYTIGDFNNDGKDDIAYLETGHNANSNNQYPLKIIGFENEGNFNIVLNDKPKKMFASDFNGDGLTDVMVFVSNGYTIFWNQGNGISDQTLDNSRKTNGSTIVNNWIIRPGDFNGDGLMDYIMNESMGSDASATSSWYFAFNNGDGSFIKQLACTLNIFDQTFTDKDNDKFDCVVSDFDLDGKSDVIIHKAMYNQKDDILGKWGEFVVTRTYWMRSTGTALSQVSSATSTNESYGLSKYLVTGDFNGDGKVELMNYGTNIYSGTGTSPQQWQMYSNPNVHVGIGMLASVTNGFDLNTSVSYATLTKSSIYTKDIVGAYPVINITPPMPAVQSIVHDNGIYNTNGVVGKVTENYMYSGAKVHLQGKGFLGFKSTITSNQTTGVMTESGYNTLDLTWFAPSDTYSKTIVGGDTAVASMTYTFVDKLKRKVFVKPNKKTEKDLDGYSNTTTYTFNDTYGYMTDEKIEFDGNVNMYKTTQYRNFIKAGGKYQPQLVTSISKHVDDNQAFTQTTKFTFDVDKGYPLTKVENFSTYDASNNSLALTTQYTLYDTFGNLKEYKVSGFGVPEITYKTEYDPTNRFVAKKYTSPASATTSFAYDTWGNVTSETDETNPANPLTTDHTYNNWGQKTSTTLSDRTKTTYLSGWDNKEGNKKYFTLTQGKGQPWVKTWYDAGGRETFSESVGPKGMKIESEKTYNNKGQLTMTWNRQGDLFPVVNYDYDARGRMKYKSIYNGQRTDYTYDKRKVKVITNGITTTKTFDAWGGLKTVADTLAGNVAYTYKSVGKPGRINAKGAVTTMDYDPAGNQKLLRDPNAGPVNYTYDAAGRVKTQVDSIGNNLSVSYDAQGRMATSTLKGISTVYTYGTTGYDINRLTKVETGANSTSYTYDGQGRIATETRMIDGAGQVTFGFEYNANGQLETTTYPGGVQVIREYDAYGNPVKITSQGQTVWELTGAGGRVTTTRLGGKMIATTSLDAQGFLQNQATVKAGSPNIRDFGYSFNAATGNLNYRINGLTGLKESFVYDALDRLKSVKEGAAEVQTMAIEYMDNGNILSKTGLGTYGYDGKRPHAVALVDYNLNLMPSTPQLISYTAFNKATRLKETAGTDSLRLDILYGPDQQRWKSVLKKNGNDVKTIIFADDYEKFIDNGVTRELYYIGTDNGLAAIYLKPQSGQANMYYVHTDHLGSIVSLTDSAGVAVFKASYDAWGKQTVTLNTISFYRGYTGHEHLPEFGLINMNGRMYDPVVGRFLSPDNYVQAADFSQSYNRYSYCVNNPLKYTDPSGDLFWIIPNISFSPNGGLNFSLTFGVGVPRAFGGQLTVGGGAGGFNVTAGGFFGPANAYAGYSSSGGFIAGAGLGFGGLPNGFNTNLTGVGVNYSSSGGLSFNMSAVQFDAHGNMTIDPSIGYSKAFYYNPKETLQYVYDDQVSQEGDGPNVPYSQENADKFYELNFAKQNDLVKLYADRSAPDGDTYEDGNIIHNGGKALGATVLAKGWGLKSNVYLAEKAFVTTQKLYLVMQHEFVHVRLNALGYSGKTHFHESIAYKVSSDQAYQWGMSYGSDYRKEAINHSKNVNFTPSYTPTFYIRKFHPVW